MLHGAQVGEPFSTAKFYFSDAHGGGTPTKDLSSDHNASVATECASAWVATLSNIFEKQCEFHIFLRMRLGYMIAADSSVVNALSISESPRQNVVPNK